MCSRPIGSRDLDEADGGEAAGVQLAELHLADDVVLVAGHAAGEELELERAAASPS